MNLWPWFSLTREFPAPRTDYDWPPYQERAIPTPDDLAAMRTAGLDFVRLPVDQGPLLAFSGARRSELLADIVMAVETALAAGLSVVVNLRANGATHHYTPRNLIRDLDSAMFATYLDVVAELAVRLARFDPARVAFEPANEPPLECASPKWPLAQREIVRAARVGAPALTLIVTGACGSMIAGLETLDPVAVGDDNVLYTFHFYEPYVFSHQGALWLESEPMYRYLVSVPWPAAARSREATFAAVRARLAADLTTLDDEKRHIAAALETALNQYFDAHPDRWFIERKFKKVKAWADRHGIDPAQLLLGEFGALRTDDQYVGAAPGDRARYVRDVRESAEALGIPWAFWNLFDGMGLTTDDRSRRFDPLIVAALGLDLSAD